MHEFSIALQVVDSALDTLRKYGGQRITDIHLRIGSFCGVAPESLAFVFPDAAASTLGAPRLHIETIALRLSCKACAAVTTPDEPLMLCESCGSIQVEATAGHELIIARVEME